jgi:tetratricopeptide (TPR) repeat protein
LLSLVELHGLYLQLGDTLKAEARMQRAIAALQQRWTKDSSDVRLLIQISDLQRRQGDSLEAERTMDHAIANLKRKIDHDSTGFKNVQILSELYILRGDTAAALQAAEEWTRRAPQEARGYLLLGKTALTNNRLQMAVANLEKGLALAKDDAESWFLLGNAYTLLQQHENALQSFERANRIAPQNPLIQFYLGYSLSQQRKHEEAVVYFERALAGQPDNANWMGALAATLDELGRHAESDSVYQSALHIKPDDATLLNNFAYSLSERAVRLDQALQMAQRAIQVEPNNGAFLDTIGWIHYQRKEYQIALEYILKSVAVRDTSAEVMEHLGDVYDKLNQPEQARTYWQKALELDGSRKTLQQKLGLNQGANGQ